ncbi:hypothetical protein LAZ67_16002366, partial [Cordylochernes scorpioides]
MTSTLINTPLEKLNDQNYRSWKYNTKMMLIERELWKYVTEPAPDEEASRTIFNMKQEKALAMIALTISPSQQIHIMDCTTAREAWDTLEQVYEPKSRSRILQLKKQFISIRFEEQETMTNYLGRLKICSDHLREAGAEMQDQDLAYSMLAGLPESYDGIIMTFSNVEDKEFTSSKVKHVLLAEYERRMARRVNNTNEALQFGTTTRKEDKKKKNFTCYKCGKEGHIARSCRGKAKTPAPNFQPPRCSTHEIAGSEMLTALSCAIPENSWVIDSGANHHVCNKREWFTNFQGITSDPILTASGTTRAEGCGDIKFKAYVGKHHVDLKLCNVLYVPNVRRNLLSVSSMENKGKIINFANRRAQVFDSENRIVAIAHDENGLYVMKGRITLFCLKHKNEVLKHFDSYLARAERETGRKLKVLRSDNGLEYCNHEFKTRLEQLGIKHELTNTYSPPMNGVAERANRVLLDITRSCLHSADLPQRFWAEAVNTAAYIRNKCYNSALGDKVPDELWSSRKPSVRHLKAFGCLAYSHIPTERRKKLDNRANRCILVGYSSQTKGYRLWCPETQHVIQTKHVKFDESKIGLKWTKVEDEPERYNHIWIEPDNQLEGDIDLKPEAERERNDDTSDQDLVGVNNDDIVQTRPKRIVRNPYGRAGKPKAELHFLDIIEPTTFEQAINSKEAPYWRRAMKDELRSLEDRNTWTLSDLPLGKRPISSRWVFKIKTNSKGDVERFKARLVARGFSQKRNVDFFETYSPVINFSVIRMIFALTINKNWYNRHLDVDNAYLYGELNFEDKAVIAVYVDDLALFAESEDILTTDKEKEEIKHVPYRELIGSLLYLANSSRPDMTFAVTKLAQFCSNPGERHWQAAKHILRYLQATKNVSLIYKRGPASTNSPTSGSRAWLIRDTTCKMTSTLINTPLEKLNDQNYRSWKYNTKMMLIERELWKYVTEPAPDEEASRTIFNMKQEKALAMIALTISPSQQIHIMDCTTAREAWDTLEQVYEPKSRSRILQLKKQFISIRFEEQETMTNYLGRLKICSDHLREAGAEMQDQDLAYSMLAGLPESYDGIIMTFSNVEDKEFTSSKVKHVLLAEYERRMARRVNNTNEALQFGTTTRKEDKKKKNFTCYKCGKEGHIARSCRGKAKTPAPNFQPPRCSTHEIAGSEMLTALSCAIPENSWVIDSGANHHVCNKREWFTNFQGITSDPILTASGTTRAEGCGDIKFKAYVGKHHVDLKLCNVLYVPNVRRNLLSVSSMENKGKIINFANRRAQVFDSENRIVAIAHDENGLYVMKGRVILPNAELFNSQKSSRKQTLELWHQRFCHVNNDAIERMAKGGLVKGLEISSMDRSLCDDCCVAKSTKEPHKPIRNIRSKRPLELVHTDICGPMPVISIGGSAYFLTFIDDYSRKITLFCLKHKNEVLKHFESYLARAERETGRKLKVLRSDNGLEYCNHEFKTRLEQLGIKHELTNTYSPPMNGVAERANRVLLDITRSCLHSADLPQRFWAEAVNTAAYIRNKCYNSALGDKVPDELWSSRKPSVRHLKAFGCLAYSHIPTERRKKLDNRANRCILVGYSSQTKGYRLWCPETQHVIQTKHVKFDESKIGLKWTKVEDEPERYNHIWIEPDNQLEGDIDLKPEAERERNDDTSDQDLVGVNNDDIVQTRPKRIVRNPYGRAGKPKAELHFLDIIEPTTFEQAINSKEAPYWRRAMKDELRSLEDRNTWTLSDLPLGKRPISSRWVFKIKTNSKGDVERFKARLFARGFSQKRNVDFFETYSPVINFSVIRMIFALTINKNWYNRHLDVDNAYLYGELNFEDKAVIAVYVDDLALFAESEDILTTDKEKEEIKHVPYRELIGSLLYLANSSRPDMTFAVTKLAQFCSNPGERHWQAAKHILRYLQATKNVSLIYKRGSDDILAFSDSDWANDIDDRRSTSGSAVTINGCLVSWRSKKQNCVSLSTMESEYIALAQTTKEILWIAQILENLKCLTNASRPITIFCDNRAAIEFSKNNIENNRSKHIDIRYHYIREKVNSGDIHVNYISTNDNLADIFTKGLKRTAHQNACAAMNCLDTGILPDISK